MLTIPEQIANRVAAAIVNGEYRDGERLLEQELAESCGVSRGPVREAIRELERSGLVVLRPRRGAHVVGVSLDVIAEAFNARAALAGIAARQLARRREAAGRAANEMTDALATAEALVDAGEAATEGFAVAISRVARCVYRHCGAGHIKRALNEQVERSIWGLMWRAKPLDFRTSARRAESLGYWRRIQAAIRAGDERAAERLIRAEILTTRDSVIAMLAHARRETVDTALMIQD
jgi:DNA-binding GntR family transcriptional regulator